MSENIYPSVLKKQIIAFLIRKEKEVKKTYPIFKVCTSCKQKKPMVDFPSGGTSKIKKDGTSAIKGARRYIALSALEGRICSFNSNLIASAKV